MKVIIHVGAPKTGSSALQYFLHDNRARLEKHGFYYPSHNFDENNVSGGHAHLGNALSKGDFSSASKLFAEWVEEAKARNCALLISSEALYRASKSVAKLVTGFDEVTVIAYFRHPLESLVSNHNQSIKRHYSTQSLEDFLYKQVGILNQGVSGQVLGYWSKNLADAAFIVRPYSVEHFTNGSIELDFLHQLGIYGWAAKRFKRSKRRVNSSYTPGALEIKRLLNGVLDVEQPHESRLIDRALQHYSDQQNQLMNTPTQLISESVFNAITERYTASLKKVQQQFWVDSSVEFYPRTVAPAANRNSSGSLMATIEAYLFLEKQLPELMKQLRERLQQQLIQQKREDESKPLPYVALKLAEIMGIPVPEPQLQTSVPSTLVPTLMDPSANKVDYLLEVTKWLARQGQLNTAIKLLNCALETLVDEHATKSQKQALEKQLDSYQQRLSAINESSDYESVIYSDEDLS